VREIKLTQGKVALVNDEDYDVLRQYNWCVGRNGRTFYAVRNVPKPGGGQNTERMHRIVLARKLGREIAPGMVPDHEDGNGLNNQRYNLREVTGGQNMRNCRKRSANPSSKHLGVSWFRDRSKWRADISNGKKIYLGSYETELEAALAREAYITAHPELMAKSNEETAKKPTRKLGQYAPIQQS
jgi:hypothetical protein